MNAIDRAIAAMPQRVATAIACQVKAGARAYAAKGRHRCLPDVTGSVWRDHATTETIYIHDATTDDIIRELTRLLKAERTVTNVMKVRAALLAERLRRRAEREYGVTPIREAAE